MPALLLPSEVERRLAFARKAADHFLSHPKHWTYTDGEIVGDSLFAVRWGVAPEKAHAVLVLKLADEEPVIYGDLDYDRAARNGEADQAMAPPGPPRAPTVETWRMSQRQPDAVITDTHDAGPCVGGSRNATPEAAREQELDWYGGHFVCESVNPSYRRRILACPAMLHALLSGDSLGNAGPALLHTAAEMLDRFAPHTAAELRIKADREAAAIKAALEG